jgi:hypothetical protein
MTKLIFLLVFVSLSLSAREFNAGPGDTLDFNTENTNRIKIKATGETVFQTLSPDTVPFINPLQEITSSSITSAELGFLMGLTSTAVGINDFQIITNKDIDGLTASDQSRITLPKDTTANLNLLTDKEATIAYDTTLGTIVINDGVGWNEVSGGGGGSTNLNTRETNYVSNPSFESGLGGWTNTGGTFTQESYVNGNSGDTSFARFVATSAGEYFETDFKITPDNAPEQGIVEFEISTSDAFNYKVCSDAGCATTPLDAVSITASTTWLRIDSSVLSLSPTENIKLRIESEAAGTIDVDNVWMGTNRINVDSRSKNLRVERCAIDGGVTPLVDPDYGDCPLVSQIVRNGAGNYTITFNDLFAEKPTCYMQVSAFGGSFTSENLGRLLVNSETEIRTETFNTSLVAEDDDYFLLCVGDKK